MSISRILWLQCKTFFVSMFFLLIYTGYAEYPATIGSLFYNTCDSDYLAYPAIQSDCKNVIFHNPDSYIKIKKKMSNKTYTA